MRFTSRIYRDGDTRVVTFFAWFPVVAIDGFWRRTRWLETVTVKQRYEGFGFSLWHDEEFIDE